MNFYTLTYDADLPAVQQVNVPTNTDYKVGMKVKRNGNVQSIKPSEFVITSEDGTTLSADSEKTNGYVTITKASGDNASFKQYGVHIDKGYDFNDAITCHGFSTSTTQISAMINSSDYDTDALGIVGIEVFAKDLYKGGITNLSADSDDPANITRWILVAEYGTSNSAKFIWKVKSDSTIDETTYYWPDYITKEQWEYHGHPAHEGPGFYKVENGVVTDVLESIIIPSGYRMGDVGLKPKANKYYIMGWKFTAGTPFSADFKLNVNTFKSQQGDIAETVSEMPAVKVDGTYADGTEFSYSFVTK